MQRVWVANQPHAREPRPEVDSVLRGAERLDFGMNLLCHQLSTLRLDRFMCGPNPDVLSAALTIRMVCGSASMPVLMAL